MSNEEKIGVDLPHSSGQWKWAHTYLTMNAGDKLPFVCPADGDYVIYRRLPEPNPMPEVNRFDGVTWDGFSMRRHGLVVDFLGTVLTVRDVSGRKYVVELSEVISLSRDGSAIWTRR
jgi:hypothetical protein